MDAQLPPVSSEHSEFSACCGVDPVVGGAAVTVGGRPGVGAAGVCVGQFRMHEFGSTGSGVGIGITVPWKGGVAGPWVGAGVSGGVYPGIVVCGACGAVVGTCPPCVGPGSTVG